MAIQWHIGCSGFYYKEWKELFYPKGLPQKQWFEYYCQHFNTLEINNTFYRFPQLKNLQAWQQRSPENFLFSVKAPGTVTHYKQFVETESVLNDFYAIIKEGLGEKLGPVLFQLPPRLSYSTEKLEQVLQQIDSSFLNIIEFRNDSWWRQDVIDILTKNKIVFCGVSFPGLKDEVVVNADTCYYRFHGVPKLFHSSYDHEFLKKTYLQIKKYKTVKTAFVYFNNTASAAALENAGFVKGLLKKRTK